MRGGRGRKTGERGREEGEEERRKGRKKKGGMQRDTGEEGEGRENHTLNYYYRKAQGQTDLKRRVLLLAF